MKAGRRYRAAWALWLLAAASCALHPRIAQTAASPHPDAAVSGTTDAATPNPPSSSNPNPNPTTDAAVSCPTTLAARLHITPLTLSADVRYKRRGYDYFPLDERIGLSADDAGDVELAWLEQAGDKVHVQAFDAQLSARGPEVVVAGMEVGGLSARPDGFALLTRRDDPGQPLTDPNQPSEVGLASEVVRFRNGQQLFAAALTGLTSITQTADSSTRDCAAPVLNGRLVWNGAKYGAYFAVHGCAGDPHAGLYADKLVYFDDSGGALSGGWSWNCNISYGMQLVAEPDVFTSLCMSDGRPNPGMNLVIADQPAVQLSPELTTDGYVAGQFGTVLKLSDETYFVAWLSRGLRSDGRALKPANDIAVLRLAADHSLLEAQHWVHETPDIAETNLHVAPYGPRHVLMIWDAISGLSCSQWTCFGSYAGTHAQLLDLHGSPVGPDETIGAVPNSQEDLRVLPDGDVIWAYVPEDARSYAAPLDVDASGVPRLPAKHTIDLARLRFCE